MIIQSVLKHLFVVPVIRGLVEPSFTLLDNIPTELTSLSLRDMGASFASTLVYSNRVQLQKKISEMAEKITGIRVEVDVLPSRQLVVKNPLKNVNMLNEGFGSNQLLFILEALVSSESGSLIAVEEPEIHLHPIAQSVLSDVICDIMESQNKQIIVSTHSEHIIYGVLGRIARKSLIIMWVGWIEYKPYIRREDFSPTNQVSNPTLHSVSPWEQIFYGEFDGQRNKRVLVKVIGE